MFSRDCTQFEQAGFRCVEGSRIVNQCFRGGRELVFCFTRFDHRTVQRTQRLCKQRVFGGYAVEPPRGYTQSREG